MKSIKLTTTLMTVLLVFSMFGIAGAQTLPSLGNNPNNNAGVVSGMDRTMPPISIRDNDSGTTFNVPPQFRQARNVFVGSGFLLSNDEEKAKWFRLNLILKKDTDNDNEIKDLVGTANIGPSQNFKVKGTLNGEEITLEFYKMNFRLMPLPLTNSYPISNEDIDDIDEIIEEDTQVLYATFEGTLKNYREFRLLRGKLTVLDGEDWDLTSFSRNIVITRNPTIVSEGKASIVRGIGVSEVIPITSSADSVTDEPQFYVQPIRVYRPMFLYFIPNPFAKKIVETRIVRGDSVRTIKIRDGETKIVDGYKIKAKNLEEENIEFEISKE